MREWLEDANCLDLNPDIFFVERGQSSEPARLICNDCVVKVECLEENLHERMGIYGSTSERERRKIRGLGITAAQYIKGKADGSIVTPKRGRPAQKVA